MLLENGLDVAHLDVTQGWRALGDREVGRGDRRVGRGGMLRPVSGGELGRQVLGMDRAIAGEIDTRSIALASSQMFPGES